MKIPDTHSSPAVLCMRSAQKAARVHSLTSRSAAAAVPLPPLARWTMLEDRVVPRADGVSSPKA
jgi:hypothetical protein